MAGKKPPAFMFYANDFRSSSRVKLMGRAGRGDYIMLLSAAWDDGSIPNDVEALAVLAEAPLADFKKTWPKIKGCWVPMEGDPTRLVNLKMEEIRAEQVKWRERLSESGKRGVEAKRSKQPKPPDDSSRASRQASSQAYSGVNGRATNGAHSQDESPASSEAKPEASSEAGSPEQACAHGQRLQSSVFTNLQYLTVLEPGLENLPPPTRKEASSPPQTMLPGISEPPGSDAQPLASRSRRRSLKKPAPVVDTSWNAPLEQRVWSIANRQLCDLTNLERLDVARFFAYRCFNCKTVEATNDAHAKRLAPQFYDIGLAPTVGQFTVKQYFDGMAMVAEATKTPLLYKPWDIKIILNYDQLPAWARRGYRA